MICKKCGGTAFVKSGVSSGNGDQIYKCKNCGTRRMEEYRRILHVDINKHCPSCGSMIMRKCGKDRNGVQRYKCKTCGAKFVEHAINGESHRKDLTEEEKRVIYYYGYILKLPYKQIAEHLHRHINTIKNVMVKIKKKYDNKPLDK